MARAKSASKSMDKNLNEDIIYPAKDQKRSPKKINCMKEALNFVKGREESRTLFIRHQAFGYIREYVEGRKKYLFEKNKKNPSEEMRNQQNTNFQPKGKPLVTIEGINFGKKIVNRAGLDHQLKTYEMAVQSVKDVIKDNKKKEKERKFFEISQQKFEKPDSPVKKQKSPKQEVTKKDERKIKEKQMKKLKKLKKTQKIKEAKRLKAKKQKEKEKLAKQKKKLQLKKPKKRLGRPRKYPNVKKKIAKTKTAITRGRGRPRKYSMP